MRPFLDIKHAGDASEYHSERGALRSVVRRPHEARIQEKQQLKKQWLMGEQLISAMSGGQEAHSTAKTQKSPPINQAETSGFLFSILREGPLSRLKLATILFIFSKEFDCCGDARAPTSGTPQPRSPAI
jgi:hypothetical protein